VVSHSIPCEATISRLFVISLAGCRRVESVILAG
jgi:hypothetical protein